jgi:cytochrome c oxidase subunit 3
MLDAKPGHRLPARAVTIGMWLFLAALTMLFGATLIGYVIIRTTSASSPPRGAISLPNSLVLSTAMMLLGSFTIHQALVAVRREKQLLLRRYLVLSCALAIGFVAIQVPAMIALIRQHQALNTRGVHLYGLVFVLVLVHALHVLGGIIGLAITTAHAYANQYDHEHHAGVKHAAMYWHFLDIVWLVMYGTLLLTA